MPCPAIRFTVSIPPVYPLHTVSFKGKLREETLASMNNAPPHV